MQATSLGRLSTLPGTRYSIVLLVFFGPHIFLQFPATLAIRKIGPRIFLSTIVLIWGVVMTFFGFVHDWKALVALRLLLGALEAGCFPGQYYLLSMWYFRYDMHKRFSIWYVIGVLGSAFGGIFALLFTQMGGLAGYRAWRWIFIMEGIITCLIGILGYIFMVDFPEQSTDRQDAEVEKFSWSRFLTPALDFKVWVFALMFFCATIGAYSVGFYLPLILKRELGFSTEVSQVLSSPPYLFANVVMFIEGWICDRYRIRGSCVIFNSSMSIIGLCLMAYRHVPGSQYVGVLLVTAGSSANIPAVILSLIRFGGTGGIAGSLVFRSQDAPKYLPGIYATITYRSNADLSVIIRANCVSVLLVTLLSVYFYICNTSAKSGTLDIEELADFRYTL
ncbi:major facilitator superfamily domain-containing protein [Cadophora sp. MPI-SDFR-AT-0126]|nr:major facilitator superfamily domain-containing protein [Leotiomycetes sp. MPI-SDFR-AT-0126]